MDPIIVVAIAAAAFAWVTLAQIILSVTFNIGLSLLQALEKRVCQLEEKGKP